MPCCLHHTQAAPSMSTWARKIWVTTTSATITYITLLVIGLIPTKIKSSLILAKAQILPPWVEESSAIQICNSIVTSSKSSKIQYCINSSTKMIHWNRILKRNKSSWNSLKQPMQQKHRSTSSSQTLRGVRAIAIVGVGKDLYNLFRSRVISMKMSNRVSIERIMVWLISTLAWIIFLSTRMLLTQFVVLSPLSATIKCTNNYPVSVQTSLTSSVLVPLWTFLQVATQSLIQVWKTLANLCLSLRRSSLAMRVMDIQDNPVRLIKAFNPHKTSIKTLGDR